MGHHQFFVVAGANASDSGPKIDETSPKFLVKSCSTTKHQSTVEDSDVARVC